MNDLEKVLDNFKAAILSKSEKKQRILINWLDTWTKLLKREDKFNPKYMPYYKRGDRGETLNGFIDRAIDETMKNDKERKQ